MRLSWFFAGMATGIGAAVLFTPVRGSEVRRRVAQTPENLTGAVRKAWESRFGSGGDGQSSEDADFLRLLNSVDREELLGVYGIGPVIADQIIQNRPFRSANELVERKIVPEAGIVRLKNQLTSRRPA
jgi:DNA uptake protein ComE-like DNA-binding protein